MDDESQSHEKVQAAKYLLIMTTLDKSKQGHGIHTVNIRVGALVIM